MVDFKTTYDFVSSPGVLMTKAQALPDFAPANAKELGRGESARVGTDISPILIYGGTRFPDVTVTESLRSGLERRVHGDLRLQQLGYRAAGFSRLRRLVEAGSVGAGDFCSYGQMT